MSAAFTFGSVGDIIAICQVVIQLRNALKGSAAEYQELRKDLDSFNQLVMHVVTTLTERQGCPALDDLYNTTISVVGECRHAIVDLLTHVVPKYDKSLGASRKTGELFWAKHSLRKIEFAVREKEKICHLRTLLGTKTQMLGVLVTTAMKESNRVDSKILLTRIAVLEKYARNAEDQGDELLRLLREQTAVCRQQLEGIRSEIQRNSTGVIEVRDGLSDLIQEFSTFRVLVMDSLDPTNDSSVTLEDTLGSRDLTSNSRNGICTETITIAPGVKVFDRDVPAELEDRFLKLKARHSKDLLKTVSKGRTRVGDIFTKLKYLGESEQDAKLYIVVQCAEQERRRVGRFFAKKIIREDLGSDFRVVVVGVTVQFLMEVAFVQARQGNDARNSTSGVGLVSVYAPLDWRPADEQETLCGSWIRFGKGDDARKATLGGLIHVLREERSEFYGITVAHIERPLSIAGSDGTGGAAGDDSDDSNDSDESDDTDNDDAEESKESVQSNEANVVASQMALSKHGTADEGVVAISQSRSAPLCHRDWCLIHVSDQSWLPNLANIKAGDQTKSTRLPITKTSSAIRASTGVVVLCHSGYQFGTLRASRSSMLISPGREFATTYDLVLDPGSQLRPGDSGAWVIERDSALLYGHVVSIDIFGEAQIMPIEETFNDIRRTLSAETVGLFEPELLDQARNETRQKSESPTPTKGPALQNPPEQRKPIATNSDDFDLAQRMERVSVNDKPAGSRDSGRRASAGLGGGSTYGYPSSKSSRSGAKHTYTWMWYCSHCAIGPNRVDFYDSCPGCGHSRCGSCQVVQEKTRI